MWAEERNIADAATLRSTGAGLSLDVDALMAEAATESALQDYRAYTEEAPRDGVFGSPFYIFQGEPFWGQDRLDFLEEAVARAPRVDGPTGEAAFDPCRIRSTKAVPSWAGSPRLRSSPSP
jgi:predicted DsbA family dithiol-disulfide isomerase